ncbi:hypothetical protein AAFF_G00412210 [Aldrovandia affinis]|uniref:Uncharacterized protein n=1 Tax=Aldrovandia affinis TaxID=143900 RepID=A0AAD7WKM3_9TELE|nr:hypothetical protein AAFF_G00412210 [Aldrovandia affinis]
MEVATPPFRSVSRAQAQGVGGLTMDPRLWILLDSGSAWGRTPWEDTAAQRRGSNLLEQPIAFVGSLWVLSLDSPLPQTTSSPPERQPQFQSKSKGRFFRLA